jgi:hypothetical protein
MNAPSILWFRLDLRLADNPALHAAVNRGGPVDWLERVKQRDPQLPAKRASYMALVEHLDHNPGRVFGDSPDTSERQEGFRRVAKTNTRVACATLLQTRL